MSSQECIGVGLLGLGVVGSSVLKALLQKTDQLSRHIGRPIDIRRALVRDVSKPRGLEIPSHILTTSPEDILHDPATSIVVEVMGGDQPALDYIKRAIQAGKHVVTANKEVMAKHGPEVLALADQHGTSIMFEASVGGGIPIINPLMQDLRANQIESIHAIINGTTNYILTRMAKDNLDFATALKEAQTHGYAEANPADDIDGVDAAYKLSIISTLAFHTEIRASDVYHEGISNLGSQDFRYAQELGYAIKLMAIARREGESLQLRVHPTLIPEKHLLAKVDGVFNAIEIEGDLAGKIVFHGRGAGAAPTCSAILADILNVARNIAAEGPPMIPSHAGRQLRVKPMAELDTQFYLHLYVADQPGVLSQIAKILGDLNVSISSVIQKETNYKEGTAGLVITTHTAREADVQKALRQIAQLEMVQQVRNFVRVENWPP